MDSNFSWQPHIEAILAKATQRLYSLKQLTRAGVPHFQLRHFYVTVNDRFLNMRPCLAGLNELEVLRKCAIQIYSLTYSLEPSFTVSLRVHSLIKLIVQQK